METQALTPMQRRLSNLRPFQKGCTGNPGGRPKTAHVRQAIKSFMLEKQDLEINGKHWKGSRIRCMLGLLYEKAVNLIPDSPDLDSLMKLMDFIRFTAEQIDGKAQANPSTLRETSQEHTVFVTAGGKIEREEQTITASQVLTELPGEEEDDANNRS
jgi:hypothetical protein